MTVEDILHIVEKSHPVKRILSGIQSKREIYIKGLAGSLRALFLAALYKNLHRPIIFITGEEGSEELFRDDLESLLGQSRVASFPRLREFAAKGSLYDDHLKNELLSAIQKLLEKKKFITILPAKTLAHKFPSLADFRAQRLYFEVGKILDFEFVKKMLSDLGFVREYLAESWGEMSVRGGIVDIFPYGSDSPYRVEFFGDKIESIRSYDPVTQRSVNKIHELAVYSQFPEQTDENSLSFEKSILDYFDDTAIVVVDEKPLIERNLEEFFGYNPQQTTQLIKKQTNMGDLFFPWEKIKQKLEKFTRIEHNSFLPDRDFSEVIDFGAQEQESLHGNVKLLKTKVAAYAGMTNSGRSENQIFFLCARAEQVERLSELFEDAGVNLDKMQFVVSGLSQGFIFRQGQIVVLTDNQFYGRRSRWRKRKKIPQGLTVQQLNTLSVGDFVVHVDKGIGIYRGLKKITVLGHERECLSIEYRDGDMLYVPLERMDRIQKYSAKEGAIPTISKLGSKDWDRLKKRTKKRIKDIARKLTVLYAKRKLQSGHAFSEDSLWQKELEASFEFEDTPDQRKATIEVKRDMEKTYPMDRVICGDVGYGKTEVAIRAAFKAVNDNKQAAVLVPTTILALQHYELFKKRLEKFPVRIEMLSRFRSRSEQKYIIEKLAQGKIDVVIGTHRLLSKDVQFKNLGLLIIDEEHRFGVNKKEQLKTKYVNVDVLSMSATPIPRTLNMALLGIRDMSLIATAPQNRRSIHTEIAPFNLDLIRSAILKEVDRGGQVFFVHNRVGTIESMANIIRRHVPEISVAVAHGQMDERQLEKVMWDFATRKYHCLVSTMIIESGLDIPNVNTMIINRADRFGLSQLYQLRGRVGRSDQQAFAYLLAPSIKSLTRGALKRLRIIEEFADLGAGFNIAMRDLEIRGAGNLLGTEQSGHIVALGFDLYTKIIDEAIQELKAEQEGKPVAEIKPRTEVKIIFEKDAYLPDKYIDRPEFKVDIYRRLANAAEVEKVEQIREEVIDRFGRMPEPAKNLFNFVVLKLLAQRNDFKVIKFFPQELLCFFSDRIAKAASRELIENKISWIIDKAHGEYQFVQGKEEGFGIKILIPEKEADPLEYGKNFLMNLN
ncbi:MAG: transcription-repair coupling factor [Calditrichaeota bacterium]|nr:transcription-repair coupling factor [Calditrichota bacterium]